MFKLYFVFINAQLIEAILFKNLIYDLFYEGFGDEVDVKIPCSAGFKAGVFVCVSPKYLSFNCNIDFSINSKDNIDINIVSIKFKQITHHVN